METLKGFKSGPERRDGGTLDGSNLQIKRLVVGRSIVVTHLRRTVET